MQIELFLWHKSGKSCSDQGSVYTKHPCSYFVFGITLDISSMLFFFLSHNCLNTVEQPFDIKLPFTITSRIATNVSRIVLETQFGQRRLPHRKLAISIFQIFKYELTAKIFLRLKLCMTYSNTNISQNILFTYFIPSVEHGCY